MKTAEAVRCGSRCGAGRARSKDVLFCSWRRRSRVLLPGVEDSRAPGVGGLILLPDVEGSRAPGVGVLFYS